MLRCQEIFVHRHRLPGAQSGDLGPFFLSSIYGTWSRAKHFIKLEGKKRRFLVDRQSGIIFQFSQIRWFVVLLIPRICLQLFHHTFSILSQCLTHTWYISADFQLFILAVVVIGILNSHKKTGILLIYSIIATGMIFTGWVAFHESHVPAIILANKDWW